MKKYLHHHPVTGVYLFYENWSTETSRKKESKKQDICYNYKTAK
jgi:hypothetical protein